MTSTTRGERSHRDTSDVRLPIDSGRERSGLLSTQLENDSPRGDRNHENWRNGGGDCEETKRENENHTDIPTS